MGFFDRLRKGGDQAIVSWTADEVTSDDIDSNIDSQSDDDNPPMRSGPGYNGAPIDLVDEVADWIGKTADEVTSDDIDSYIDSQSDDVGADGYVYSDCDECGDLPWIHYCPECHRVDD